MKENAVLNVGLALIGEELELRKNVSLKIEGGAIVSIDRGFKGFGLTFKHGIAMPALVNAHLHVLDYAFQEVGLDLKLPELVSEPHGLKHKLISNLDEASIIDVASKVFGKLAAQGAYRALVFCERSDAARHIKEAAKIKGLEVSVLTRPKRFEDKLNIEEALEWSDGLGLDSPLRFSERELELLGRECLKSGKVRATHLSETRSSHEKGDFSLALKHFNADMVIHGVHLTEGEVEELASNGVSVVLCPRSNLWFSSGIPPLGAFFRKGVNVLLGTDNSGWIEPDMWREIETLYLLSRFQGINVDPRELLKSASVNIQKVRGLKQSNNIIEEGLDANLLVLDGELIGSERSHNVYASIAKRGCPEAVLYKYFSVR